MKSLKSIITTGLLLIGAACYAGVPGAGDASGYRPIQFQSALSVVASNSVVTTNGLVTVLPRAGNSGLPVTFVLTSQASAYAANDSNVVYQIDFVAKDAVTMSTTGPLLITNKCNGSNAVTSFTFVPASSLVGVYGVVVDKITNTETNAVTSSGIISWDPL